MRHRYFADNRCNWFSYKLVGDAAVLSKRFGLRFDFSANGFTFYGAAPAAKLLNDISLKTGLEAFEFDCTCINNLFFLITDFTPGWAGQFVCDSVTSTAGEGFWQLHPQLSSAPVAGPAGKIIIRFDDIINKSKENNTPFYAVSFAQRNTQWQYYIINRSQVALANPQIKDRSVVLNGPENVTIANGQQALFFSSGENLLPLQEQPAYRFALMNAAQNGNATSKMVLRGLPNPNPSHFELVQVAGQTQVSSPMYVYL
jgi:hypothetical protein